MDGSISLHRARSCSLLIHGGSAGYLSSLSRAGVQTATSSRPWLAGGADGGASAGTEGDGAAGGDSPHLALIDSFEGEIDVTAKGDKPAEAPVALGLLIKSGKIRVDIPEGLTKSGAGPLGANAKGYGIFDSAAKKIDVVLDSSKQVIVIDLNKVGEQMKSSAPPGPRPEHGNAAPSKETCPRR